MRQVYHSDEERREARRGFDRSRTRSYERTERRSNPRNTPRETPTQEGYRRCNDCGEKPLTEFRFRNGKPAAICIECERARDRERNHLRRIRKTPEKPKATIEGYKVCNTCLIEKPYSAFMHDTAQKDGYAGRCSQCKAELYHASPENKEAKKAYNNAYREANRDQLNAYDRARHNTDRHRANRRERHVIKREARLVTRPTQVPPPHKVHPISMFKVCPRCSTEKFLAEFSLNKNRPDGHYPICKKCAGEWSRTHRAERRIYNNTRKLDSEHRASIKMENRKWRQNNKLRVQGYQLQRLARKKGAGTIRRVNFARILERDGMHCYICDKPILPHHILTFDHRIPLVPQRDEPQGTHTEENIHPAHKECNSRKSNRRLEDLTPFDRRGVD